MLIQRLMKHGLMRILISLFVVTLLVSCSTEENLSGVSISGISLTWEAPTQREDGTPLQMAEIGGYRIYYGTTSGDYPNQVDINDGTAVQALISDIPVGTYYFVATTIDIDGRESQYSTEVEIRI